jgi:hypothetical protein
VQSGDDSDDFHDRFDFRRITVDPIVGRAKMWRELKEVGGTPIINAPTCEDQTATEWQEVQ